MIFVFLCVCFIGVDDGGGWLERRREPDLKRKAETVKKSEKKVEFSRKWGQTHSSHKTMPFKKSCNTVFLVNVKYTSTFCKEFYT